MLTQETIERADFSLSENLTLEMAEKMLDAAERWARVNQVPCSIAVVDKSGSVLAVHRMDDSAFGLMTPDIAISKAYTAVYFAHSTDLLGATIDYRSVGPRLGQWYIGLMTQLNGHLNCIPGAEPVRAEWNSFTPGEVIGGIGVSGVPDGMGEISDTTVCQAGVSALYD